MIFNKEKFLLKIKNNKDDEALSFLEEYLSQNPKDYLLRIGLACFLSEAPFYSYLESLDILEEVLEHDSENIVAVVVKGVIEYLNEGDLKEKTFSCVENFLNKRASDEVHYGDLLVLKALYYEKKNVQTYHDILIQSSKVSPHFSMNYLWLSWHYKKLKHYSQALIYLEKAIENVKYLYGVEDLINPIDVEEFLNIYFRGIKLGHQEFEELVKQKNEYYEIMKNKVEEE